MPGEAAQAQAVLLTFSGWTACGVGEDSVRRWRAWFARSSVEALRSSLALGLSRERPLARARKILAALVQDQPNWTLPRLRAEVEAHTSLRLPQLHLGVLLRRGASGGAARGMP